MPDWQLTGTYLEACNCEAICPCRRIGGRPGGRSTHGICMGALSWRIGFGHADGVELEIDHTPGHGWFRAGGEVSVRVREPVPDQETVTCVIPGHHRSGRELLADLLEVTDGALEFELSGVCAYESTFEYSSGD